MEKPIKEQYIRSILTTPEGGILIVTCEKYLLGLVHKAVAIQVDTTFKRVVGTQLGGLNEWELVIWFPGAERGESDMILASSLFLIPPCLATTIGRIYTNRATAAHYKLLFDELQKVTLALTGKPLRFKRLTPGGNLLAMGVDLEAAQVQGAGLSFLPTNVPEHSKINTLDPDEIVQYFIRACFAHVKRCTIVYCNGYRLAEIFI